MYLPLASYLAELSGFTIEDFDMTQNYQPFHPEYAPDTWGVYMPPHDLELFYSWQRKYGKPLQLDEPAYGARYIVVSDDVSLLFSFKNYVYRFYNPE